MGPRILPATDLAIPIAVDALRRGELIAFPTDTVYGIGASAAIPDAVERIFQAKGRTATKALALLIAEPEDGEALTDGLGPLGQVLARQFWPGALTIVARASPKLPSALISEEGTIGLRVPSHPLIRSIIRALGAPIANSSANRSGGLEPLTTAESVLQLGDWLALVIDGSCLLGKPSTVIDITKSPPLIRREGAIPRSQVEAALGQPLT